MKLINNQINPSSIFPKTIYCLLLTLLLTQLSFANINNSNSNNLGRFYANSKNCEVKVIWNTVSETDLKLFELEWSGDGKNFYKIHTQGSSGLSPSSGLYEYLDNNSMYSNYYRLKFVKFDGTFNYSKKIFVKKKCKSKNTLSIYPNPVSLNSNFVNIEFIPSRSQSQILINDMLGRSIQRLNFEVESGIFNEFEIDISSFPPGTYNLIVVGERQAKIFVIK